MAKEKVCGIYKIENLVNGKVYIGSSKDIYKRWVGHKSGLRHNKHSNSYLQRAWNKYSEENFEFSIVEVLTEFNDMELKFSEQYWIIFYKSHISDFGYNLILVPQGINDNNVYEECIRLYRELQPNCKPIYQINLLGDIIKKWDSINQASKTLNIKDTCIISCLKHKRKTYKNYIWIYDNEADNFNLDSYIDVKYKKSNILQYDLNDIFIKEWESIKDICDFYNIKGSSNIINCCRGLSMTSHGFKWKYKNPINKDVDNTIRENRVFKNIVQLNLNNDFIKSWDSLSEAARELKINASDIGNCAKGRQKTAHGFIWIYKIDYENKFGKIVC